MALPDSRLLPLLETFTVSGADWLALELADGIRSGRTAEDPADALQRARTLARKRSLGSTPKLEESAGISSEPLAGDEQIDWAIQYVDKRLEDTVAMLVSALEGLDRIVEESSRTEAPTEPVKIASEVTLVLQDDEASLMVVRSGAIEALNAIQALKSAMSSWAATVRGGEL